MNSTLRKTLLVTIATLIVVINGTGAALLTHLGGGHITAVVRDGAIGFAATTAFILLVMTHLSVL